MERSSDTARSHEEGCGRSQWLFVCSLNMEPCWGKEVEDDLLRGTETYLSYWGHGKIQRWGSHGFTELVVILIVEGLVLGIGRPAVSRDEGIHCDVVCELVVPS